MVELKIKNKNVFLFAVLMLSLGIQLISFGGGNAMTAWMLATNNYNFYALASSLSIVGMMIALPAVGAITNKIGQRNIIFLGTGIMIFSCVMLQFCSNVYLFMLWRTLNSLGCGLVMTAPYTLIVNVYELTTAMKYYGLIATANAIGCLCGPLLAGVLIDAGYIMLPFVVWIPLALISLVILGAAYPNVGKEKMPFDVKGLVLLGLITLSFVLWTGLSGQLFPWLGPGLMLPVIVVIASVLLAKHSAKIANPTVPFFVFKYKRFGVAFIINLLINVVPTCITGYLLAYILGTMQQTATMGSTTTMPYTIVSALLGLCLGQIMAKNFQKNIRLLQIVSSAAAVISVGLLSVLQPDSSMVMVWLASGFGGITAAVSQTCLTPFFQFGMPREDYTAAQGMFAFASTGGATVFVAVVGVLVNAMNGDIRAVFWTASVLAVICFVFTLEKFKITDDEMASASRIE